LQVHGGLRLPGSANELFALNAWRGAFGFFTESFRLLRQALIKWCKLFERASLHGGAPPFLRKASATCVLITDKGQGLSGDSGNLACPVTDILVKTAHLAESLTAQIRPPDL
jgi:hypothetical protein